MRDIRDIKAAVVGTGFIGVVHVEALRRLGIEVTGIVGSTPERARREGAHRGAARSLSELRGDARRPGGRRRPPHDAEPPALRAGQGGAGGRQARRVREAARRWTRPRPPSCCALAEQSGLVHAVNFNVRFYPQCQEARARVRARRDRRRAADQRRLPAGLAAARHRLELAARPRRGRRAARGRRHRLALARPRPVHHRPPRRGRDGRPHDLHPACASSRPGRSRRSAAAAAGETVDTRDGDRGRRRDPAALRAAARAASSRCRQVVGRPQEPAAASRSTAPPARWRGSPSRPRSCGSATATAPTSCCCATRARGRATRPGHAEGFPDTFKRPLPRGLRRRGGGRAAGEPDYPTFADGHDEALIADAIAAVARRAALGRRRPRAPGGAE